MDTTPGRSSLPWEVGGRAARRMGGEGEDITLVGRTGPAIREGEDITPEGIAEVEGITLGEAVGRGVRVLTRVEEGITLGVIAVEEVTTLGVIAVEEDTTLGVIAVEEGITLGVIAVEEDITLEAEEVQDLEVRAQAKVEAGITLGEILAMVRVIILEGAKTTAKDITPEVAKTMGKDITPEGEATVTARGAEGITPGDRAPTLEEEAAEATTPEVP